MFRGEFTKICLGVEFTEIGSWIHGCMLFVLGISALIGAGL